MTLNKIIIALMVAVSILSMYTSGDQLIPVQDTNPAVFPAMKNLLKVESVSYKIDPVEAISPSNADEDLATGEVSISKVDEVEKPAPELKKVIVDNNPTTKDKPAKEKTFTHGRKPVKGDVLIEIVRKNPNGRLFYDAYLEKYGAEIADTMAISLMFENATMWEKTVGVCDAKFWIKGNRLDCNYANRNSAGFDVGVKQVNTFYQNNRINKLAKTTCLFKNKAESKERSNKCNQELIDWLIIPENNLKISLDLYSEQGFKPWYGYKQGFLKGS
jgi:hypothetical protein